MAAALLARHRERSKNAVSTKSVKETSSQQGGKIVVAILCVGKESTFSFSDFGRFARPSPSGFGFRNFADYDGFRGSVLHEGFSGDRAPLFSDSCHFRLIFAARGRRGIFGWSSLGNLLHGLGGRSVEHFPFPFRVQFSGARFDCPIFSLIPSSEHFSLPRPSSSSPPSLRECSREFEPVCVRCMCAC